MKQGSLFENTDTKNADQANLGSGCTLEFVGRRKEKAILYRNGVHLGFRSLKNDIFIFFAVSLKPRLIKKLVTVQEV
ncbi:MAG: hypothetical protein LWX52_14860 [Deltaproteobacteria bacterium]|jgi:hypothetical protein|nr:hypothetical protein [Deltaproteobacteria bacterium]